jgi:hypothetical protein
MYLKVDDMNFNSFEELCKYYNKIALDIEDLQEQLEEELDGVGVPQIQTIDKYEVEIIYDNSVNNEHLNNYDSTSKYFNTYNKARKFFTRCVMENEYELSLDSNNEELPIGIYLREYDCHNDGNFDDSELKLSSLKKDSFKTILRY